MTDEPGLQMAIEMRGIDGKVGDVVIESEEYRVLVCECVRCVQGRDLWMLSGNLTADQRCAFPDWHQPSRRFFSQRDECVRVFTQMISAIKCAVGVEHDGNPIELRLVTRVYVGLSILVR